MQTPDILMTIANFVFIAAAVPTVYDQFRTKASTIPLTTSISMLIALTLVVMALVRLELWLSVATDGVVLALWLIIAIQRATYGAPLGLTGDNRLRR